MYNSKRPSTGICQPLHHCVFHASWKCLSSATNSSVLYCTASIPPCITYTQLLRSLSIHQLERWPHWIRAESHCSGETRAQRRWVVAESEMHKEECEWHLVAWNLRCAVNLCLLCWSHGRKAQWFLTILIQMHANKLLTVHFYLLTVITIV